jgi:hypothetical protein
MEAALVISGRRPARSLAALDEHLKQHAEMGERRLEL